MPIIESTVPQAVFASGGTPRMAAMSSSDDFTNAVADGTGGWIDTTETVNPPAGAIAADGTIADGSGGWIGSTVNPTTVNPPAGAIAADGTIADGTGGWDDLTQPPADDFSSAIDSSDATAAAATDLWEDLT